MAKKFPIGANIRAHFFKAEVKKGSKDGKKWMALSVAHKVGKGKEDSAYCNQMFFVPDSGDQEQDERRSKAIYYSLKEMGEIMGADTNELEPFTDLKLFLYDFEGLLTREKERKALKLYYIKTVMRGEYPSVSTWRNWISSEPNLEYTADELEKNKEFITSSEDPSPNQPRTETDVFGDTFDNNQYDDLPF